MINFIKALLSLLTAIGSLVLLIPIIPFYLIYFVLKMQKIGWTRTKKIFAETWEREKTANVDDVSGERGWLEKYARLTIYIPKKKD